MQINRAGKTREREVETCLFLYNIWNKNALNVGCPLFSSRNSKEQPVSGCVLYDIAGCAIVVCRKANGLLHYTHFYESYIMTDPYLENEGDTKNCIQFGMHQAV